MSAYYLPWILLLVLSLWASLAAFLWALKRGQFSEQERARYLPLRGEPIAPLRKDLSGSPELIVGFAVLGIGGLVMAAVIVLLFMTGGI